MNKPQRISLIGGAAMILGARFRMFNYDLILAMESGIEFAGLERLTVWIGFVILLGGLVYGGKPGKRYSLGTPIFALLAGAMFFPACYLALAAEPIAGDELRSIPGLGLYLTFLGIGLAITGGGCKLLSSEG